MTVVIDASVAVKWLFPEREAEQAATYLRFDLVAPPMFRLECANAVVRRLRKGEISRAEATVLIGEVEFLPVEIRAVPERAIFDLALQMRHPVSDCAYLALARAENLSMVTADRRFFRAAGAAKLSARIQLLAADQP